MSTAGWPIVIIRSTRMRLAREVEQARTDLEDVIQAWCRFKDG
jgi:hypothetical protein